MKHVLALLMALILSLSFVFADEGDSNVSDQVINSESVTQSEGSEGDTADPEGEAEESEVIHVGDLTVIADQVTLQSVGDPEPLPEEPSSVVEDLGYWINVSGLPVSRLHIPSSYRDNYFGIDENGYLYNINTGTVTLTEGVYSIRFPSYAQPSYRRTDQTSQQYTYVNVSFEDSPNVSVFGASQQIRDNWYLVVIGLIGGVLLCLFIKR